MVQRIAMAPQGPEFSRFVMGYWRLMDWKMSPGELVSFIEQHLDLGVTTQSSRKCQSRPVNKCKYKGLDV